MTEQISGVIERITFHNLDTGYCVLRVSARGHRELITVVGHAQQVVAGESVTATGQWVTDRTHGLQFRAEEIRTHPPHTAEGIVRYLGSGVVRGIGPRLARRIVDVFGSRTLEVIDQSPAFLAQVRGIGPKLIEQIRRSWEEQRESRKIMVFLQSHGIGTARAVRIYKEYGDQAIELIKANPYRLSTDIWGIGFQTADQLARSLGVPLDSPFRVQAAVRHVLQEAASEGHIGLPEEQLTATAAGLIGTDPRLVAEAIEQLRQAEEVVRDGPTRITRRAGPADRDPPAEDRPTTDDLILLRPLFMAELGVARAVRTLAAGPHPLPTADVDRAVDAVQRKLGLVFADRQREAVRAAATHKLLVVTGGPGTGKTTIVRAILELFCGRSLRVRLCAPTGRAAKRLSESTGREAVTIHRLLGYIPGTHDFVHHRENPLDADLLVIDEASMVDVVLMNRLLAAVPPAACVVFVGDVDQLPSVGPGAVLTDLIDSGAVPVVRLTEVHRQAGGSWIVRAAHAVNRGEMPESAPPGSDGDFFFVEAADPEDVARLIRQMVTERIPRRFGLDPFRDIQVLTPQVKTALGVAALNKELQAALNPPRPGVPEVRRYDTVLRPGDKVMQTRNSYDREVFNGDVGRVRAVDPEEQQVVVDFDGRAVTYDFHDLDELQLAYACSIHKSQGSEYPAVVIPVHTQHYTMLQRNLLYTGITRGRKLVALVGSRKALWVAVTTAEVRRRHTLLRWRLAALAGADRPTCEPSAALP